MLPAYNEASVIADVIVALQAALNTHHMEADIVVVDDRSRDETAKVAREKGALVLSHLLNSGAGSATATGLRFASDNNYEIVATMDADGQHNPNDVVSGIMQLQHEAVDLLIGSRLINAAGMSPVKRLGNWGLSLLTFLLFGVRCTDSQSGLRIFSKNALEQLHWKASGYEFASEMLWRAKQAHLIIGEYPIKAIYTSYSKSKGQNNWNGINILKSLIRERFMEVIE